MTARKTTESDYGTVDADVLAQLKRGFATADVLAAINALEVNAGRQQWLRTCLLRLHAMASHLIDGSPKTVTAKEPVWQLAEEVGDELDAHIASLSHVAKVVDRLARLRPNNG